jgi:hypothetical protein
MLSVQRGSGPGSRDIRSALRLGANWVPELRRKATKPETDADAAKPPMSPICRGKAIADHGLLVMQKPEGSSLLLAPPLDAGPLGSENSSTARSCNGPPSR